MPIPESLLLNTDQSTTGWGAGLVFKDIPQLSEARKCLRPAVLSKNQRPSTGIAWGAVYSFNIYFYSFGQVLVVAGRISDLPCGMWDLQLQPGNS